MHHFFAMPNKTRLLISTTLILAASLLACSKPPAPAARATATPEPAQLAALGKQIFFDTSLSASGNMSCANCHDPAHGYSPANALAVQRGGADMKQAGTRAVPSLTYALNRTPIWHKETPASKIEQLTERDNPPTGGLTWDGRVNTLHEQAQIPLLAPNEMANASKAEVVAKLQKASYANTFRDLFGPDVFADTEQAFLHATEALERFQLDDASFHPYTSKYDAFLDGKATLTEAEQRGMLLFNDERKGNCNACHISQRGANGSHPLFTDYQFEVLAVPRNPEIPANADPAYFDLGLCGPARTDKQAERSYCGMFKTPSLRNVALRGAFFHNGRFHTLEDAVAFYASRDTQSGKWYGKGKNGKTVAYDDLPADVRTNVDHTAPLDAAPGGKPRLSTADVSDLVAFLRTLSDGYTATTH